MKPPFPYFGGKSRMADVIVAAMPPHDVYLEPFAGSLAVLFAKPPARHEIVNDADQSIVTFFRVLRDQPEELERVCRLTPYARAEFEAADHTAEDLTDLEVARRLWCRTNQSFGRTSRMTTGWSLSRNQNVGSPATMTRRVDRFAPCAERLRSVAIEHCDAVEMIERLASPGCVVYADPPYLAATRTSAAGGDYRHEMGAADDHERLAEVLHDVDGTVFLSGYHSALYDRLYGDWDRLEIETFAQSSNGANAPQKRNKRLEVVWSNRPIAQVVQPSLLDEEMAQ